MTHTEQDSLRHLHGVRVLLPAAWEDSSLYRFNAPLPPAEATLHHGQANRRLQPNVMVTRHPRRTLATVEAFIEASAQERMRDDRTFRVMNRGDTLYLDQPAHFEDSCFTEPTSGALVYQRFVVIERADHAFVALTLTGTPADITRMSEEMRLPAAPPADVQDIGGVGAVLIDTQRGGA
jgi:hypothetical protein